MPSQATAVEAASGMDDEPVERAIQRPESVPNDVVETSSRPKSSAFLASVTPRLVRKQIGITRDTPSASKSEIIVDRLIGNRVLHSETSDEDDVLDAIVARKNKVNIWGGNCILRVISETIIVDSKSLERYAMPKLQSISNFQLPMYWENVAKME